jgi:hypothetical protein
MRRVTRRPETAVADWASFSVVLVIIATMVVVL